MNNYFEVGLKLLAFLQNLDGENGEKLFKKVDFLQNLADVGEQRQFSPACYVVYRGESVKDTVGRGERVEITQRYTVIVAVSHASSQMNATSLVEQAGMIIPIVLKALHGKQVTDNTSPLLRVGSDTANFSNAFSYYPFTFETNIFI